MTRPLRHPDADADARPSPEPTPTVSIDDEPGADRPTLRSILLGSGPRFLRDGFGPVLGFYAGWKVGGLGLGIALATVVAFLAFRLARREERTGALSQLALGFVVVQALVGAASGSARVYLAQPVLLSGALGVAFFVSAFTKRPIIGIFAAETYPFPPEVRESDAFRRIFARCSMAWGVYQIARAGLRMFVLSQTSVDAYVLVNLVTGFPMITAMFSWTAWYSVRSFRRSAEFGWDHGAPLERAPDAPSVQPA